jgi:type I restriction enzyme S subunit
MSPGALAVVAAARAADASLRPGGPRRRWCLSTLGEVASINPATTFDSFANDAEIPFIPMATVAEEPGIIDTSRRRSVAGVRKGYVRFCEGDVIFAKITPCMENGKTAPVIGMPGGFAAGSTEFNVLRPGAVDTRYLWYWLVRHAFRHEAERNMSGSAGQLRVPVDYLRNSPISVAPFPEQRRIVARIDELFAEIAEGEAALERARQGLDTWRRALLKAAVTGELTRDWREANRPAETGADLLERTLHKRRADWEKRRAGKRSETGRLKTRYPGPDAPSAPASWELPKTWAWASLDQITRGGRPSSYGVLQPGVDVPGGIPLVRVGDIHHGRVELRRLKRIAPAIAAEYSRTQLAGGELLITLVGAIGRTAVAPPELSGANTARAVGVIRLSDPVNAAWVELWFRSPSKQIEMVGKAHEVARKTLNLEDVRAAGIAIPPRAEQDEIVARAETLIGASELEGAISDRDAQALRQAILKAAFVGRLVPQDPADEPAFALLARLREGSADAHASRGRRGRKRNRAETPELPLFAGRDGGSAADAAG